MDLLWGSNWHLQGPREDQNGATGIGTLLSGNLLAPSWCQRGLLGTPRTGPRAPWRHPNGHKMTPKGLQIGARAPKIGPRAPKIDPQGPQTDPQTFKMDTLNSKSRPPRLPQSTPWSRFSVLCSQSSVLDGLVGTREAYRMREDGQGNEQKSLHSGQGQNQ